MKGDLISRSALIRTFEKLKDNPNNRLVDIVFLDGAMSVIDVAPAIDALPVVHARWQYPLGMAWNYVCSNCGFGNPSMIVKYKYCPNCGARMDGDPHDDRGQ